MERNIGHFDGDCSVSECSTALLSKLSKYNIVDITSLTYVTNRYSKKGISLDLIKFLTLSLLAATFVVC